MWFKKKDKKQVKEQEIKEEEVKQPEKQEKPAKAEKPAKTEKPAKAEKPAKTEKAVKAEKPKKAKTEEKVNEKQEPSKGARPSYRVIYDMSEKVWLIKKDGAKRVIRKVSTKAEATKIAKELSENQNLNLTIHKKDGKFQKKS